MSQSEPRYRKTMYDTDRKEAELRQKEGEIATRCTDSKTYE